MKKELYPTKKSIRRDIILSSLGLSVFIVISYNLMYSVIVVSKFIEVLDFNSINLSFSNGYYTLNNKEMGIPILANFILILVLWYLMVWDTLKKINSKVKPHKLQNKNNFIFKFTNFFF